METDEWERQKEQTSREPRKERKPQGPAVFRPSPHPMPRVSATVPSGPLPPAHLPWTALPILQPHQWALACEGLPISRWES